MTDEDLEKMANLLAREIDESISNEHPVRRKMWKEKIKKYAAEALRKVRDAAYEDAAKIAEKADCENCATEYGGGIQSGEFHYEELPEILRNRIKPLNAKERE